MPGPYDFLAPPRIVFGWGRRREVGEVAARWGRRAFVVSGSSTLEEAGELDEIEGHLRAAGVEPVRLGRISREPLVEDVDRMAARLRERRGRGAAGGDLVLAVGGGSALDLAKATAAMAAQDGAASVMDYLEGVGRGLRIESPPLPVVALPTTSGTGSEATKNAVISSYDPPFKKSLRSDLMVPRAVVVDPELTISLPPAITAHTGMDAITQLIESFISRRARPIPRALALDGIALGGRALPVAFRNGRDREAREAMAHAALLSGLALANSGLGIAHGVAAALGVHCGVPHGLACAVMLPAALRVNLPVRRRELAQVAEAWTGRGWESEEAAARAVVDLVEELCAALGIPRRLSEIGARKEQLDGLVRSSRGNSMDGNPRDLSDPELREILEGRL